MVLYHMYAIQSTDNILLSSGDIIYMNLADAGVNLPTSSKYHKWGEVIQGP